MVPSESLALALIVMLAGAVNTALFAGLVMLTVGARFGSSVATSLPPAYMYSFVKGGVGDGGGSGEITPLKRESLILFEGSKFAEIPPTSDRQSSADTIARVNCVRRFLDPFLARRFKVDMGFSFILVQCW
jgi:hypothetical protein